MSKFGNLGIPVDVPARMPVINPFTNEQLIDQDGNPAWIDVFSSDSSRARTYQRNSNQRRIDQRGRAAVTALSIENELFGLLAELTKGWHLVDFDNNAIAVECTTQNARELYAQPEMSWLREQVDTFASSRANFAKPSAKPSSDMPSENSQASGS